MSSDNRKIALFDFCETLVNFQTADAFVDYVRNRIGSRRMKVLELFQQSLLVLKVPQIIDKLSKNKYSINKRLKLYQLKGIQKKDLENLAFDYYTNRIKPNFIERIIDIYKEYQRKGYEMYLVSGGYGIYLNYFGNEYQIDGIISSNIKFKDGVCTGLMDGPDCLNEMKVKLLNGIFDKSKIKSVAFSDSKTDLPFLNWADKGFVVSKNKHQKWSSSNQLNEIIWE